MKFDPDFLKLIPPIGLTGLTPLLLMLTKTVIKDISKTEQKVIPFCYVAAIWIGYYISTASVFFLVFAVSSMVVLLVIFVAITFLYFFVFKDKRSMFVSLQCISLVVLSIVASISTLLSENTLVDLPKGANKLIIYDVSENLCFDQFAQIEYVSGSAFCIVGNDVIDRGAFFVFQGDKFSRKEISKMQFVQGRKLYLAGHRWGVAND